MFPSSSPDVVSGVIFCFLHSLSKERNKAAVPADQDVKRDVSHVCSQIQNYRFIEELDTSCKDGVRSLSTYVRKDFWLLRLLPGYAQ